MISLQKGIPDDMMKVAGRVKFAALLKYGQITWRRRPLPDFIILGAQKCGTTSLHHYLRQHPQLMSSPYRKEIHFFDGGVNSKTDVFEKGETWYRAHFGTRKPGGLPQKTFEASPVYIFNPLVAERISELIPDARFIILLRNPTDRAISHYFHERKLDREPLPIMEAMQAEEERLRPALETRNYRDERFIHYSYKSRGHYCEQIRRYLDFFPIKNVFIMDSKELLAEPTNALRRVFEFLGVDSAFRVKDLKPLNVAANKDKVAPAVRTYLDGHFRSHNQALYELTGRDFGW
ncbi:MAG TPA: sulfotransferase domain-containing protein [Rhodanobacteraceae bacterium]